MSPLALALLRRGALLALVLAAALAVVPRALSFFGILGPSLEEEIAGVERSLDAARRYGAEESEPGYARARAELARARSLASRGERFATKRAVAAAREAALAAQRAALTGREESRRLAQRVVSETDRQLNELEDLYAQVTRDLAKPERDRLFSLMKRTRQQAAGAWLAFEEQNYRKVLAEEQAINAVLAAARRELGVAPRAPR
jgi:hypothetical protein